MHSTWYKFFADKNLNNCIAHDTKIMFALLIMLLDEILHSDHYLRSPYYVSLYNKKNKLDRSLFK